MSEDNREKILQQNMLNLFEYIEAIDGRLKVIEEEYMRYDFGYDPVETLRKRFEKMAGFDIWKAKFNLDPDKDPGMKAVLEESNKFTQHPEVVSAKGTDPISDSN